MVFRVISFLFLLLLCLGFLYARSLHSPVYMEDEWMDSMHTKDAALDDADALLSTRVASPSEYELDMPVVILVHGFAGSSYEYQELAEYLRAQGDVLVSELVLGGHGRDSQRFNASRWEDWGQPLLDEHAALIETGYRSISIVASSASATLVSVYLSRGDIDAASLRRLVFIDPFFVPKDKRLYFVPVLKHIVGNYRDDEGVTMLGRQHWMSNLSSSVLSEVLALQKQGRAALKTGWILGKGVEMRVFQAEQDPVVDARHLLSLLENVRHSDGTGIPILWRDSDEHVHTHLASVSTENISESDALSQSETFEEIYRLLRF